MNGRNLNVRQSFGRKVLFLVGLAVAAQSVTMSIAATPVPSSPMATGKALYLQKSYSQAVKHFKTAVEKNPNSCECRLNLGRALCKQAQAMKKGSPEQLQTYKAGTTELRKAIRLGKGSTNGVAANQFLMSLPRNFTAPKTGEGTQLIAMINGIRGTDRSAGETPKPKVLEFYAPWADSCKQLKPIMQKIKTAYGDQVEFISYNVDDPNTEKIAEDYEVSPIPTLIFLDPSNQVVTYAVGFSGENGVNAGLKKIMPKS